MTSAAADVVRRVVDEVGEGPWGIAVAITCEGRTHIELEAGADPLTQDSVFQIGSITKTLTGLLLADAVVSGRVELDATVGSILGDQAGAARSTTLKELATQRSGLPRLPPNLDPERVDPNDPYASYDRGDLLRGLSELGAPSPGAFEYSNFGFMLLGHVLSEAAGRSYERLMEDRVFRPLGMSSTFVGTVDAADRMPGYRSGSAASWWQLHIPGPAGVASSIRDMARYVAAMIDPPESLREAVELALHRHAGRPPTGLAWLQRDGVHWHNGGTGGFRSFVALDRARRVGIAILANTGDADPIDGVGFDALARLLR